MKRDYEADYRDLVSECAETARSLANRRSMAGLYDPLHIFVINKRLIPLAGQDVERAWSENLPMVGTIGPDVPFSSYYTRIFNLARRAPLF